jgi:DNA-binding transcriptional LysR family regulator
VAQQVERYRELYPKVKVQVRRSFSSKIPNELIDGNLELGVISFDPSDERLKSKVIYTDALAFVVSPRHRLAHRKTVSISDLGSENFVAHNVVSPYREVVLREFQSHKVPLRMDLELPTIESIRWFVQQNLGVAFLPRMCVEQDIEQKHLCEVRVKEMHVERKIRLVYPTRRGLSYAAKAFLELLA